MLKKQMITFVSLMVILLSFTITSCSKDGIKKDSTPISAESETKVSTNEATEGIFTASKHFKISNYAEAESFFSDHEEDGTQFEFSGAILTYYKDTKSYGLEYYQDMKSATGFPVESDEIDLKEYVGSVISGKGELRSRPYKDGIFRYTDITSIEKKGTEYIVNTVKDANNLYNHIEDTGSCFSYIQGTVIQPENSDGYYIEFSDSDESESQIAIPVQSDNVDLKKHLDKQTSGRGELCFNESKSLYYLSITMIEED